VRSRDQWKLYAREGDGGDGKDLQRDEDDDWVAVHEHVTELEHQRQQSHRD